MASEIWITKKKYDIEEPGKILPWVTCLPSMQPTWIQSHRARIVPPHPPVPPGVIYMYRTKSTPSVLQSETPNEQTEDMLLD